MDVHHLLLIFQCHLPYWIPLFCLAVFSCKKPDNEFLMTKPATLNNYIVIKPIPEENENDRLGRSIAIVKLLKIYIYKVAVQINIKADLKVADKDCKREKQI